MGQEMFKILDTNQDEILNQNDVEKFVENAEKISVQIDNKVKGKNSLKIIKNSHTVRNLHFFFFFSTLISRENCRFFG